MFLSRIPIDPENQQTLRALDNPEIMHAMIENCFAGEKERSLWRLDELNGLTYLLVLSCKKPDFSSLAAQIGLPGETGESRSYQPLLDRIQAGSVWRFRFTANPVVSEPRPGKARGRIRAITIAAHQREWLVRQGERHGFMLKQDQFDVMKSEWRIFHKDGQYISILSATFEGLLTVTNEDLFRTALQEGIGRGKAYGLGLLTVMSPG